MHDIIILTRYLLKSYSKIFYFLFDNKCRAKNRMCLCRAFGLRARFLFPAKRIGGKMKRKFFLTILTVIMVGSCAIGLAACGSSNEKDTHKHQLQHFDAVSATCTEDGNKEYWHCSACGKYFSDAQATAETDQSKTIIPAKGHTFSKNWSHDDTYH